MPYLQHQGVITPPDSAIVWRYMDLPKFLVTLEEKTLYFALLTELEDKWEGVLTHATTHYITSTIDPSRRDDVISRQQDWLKCIGINCWYCDDRESIAMWALYTSTAYGLTIKSSISRLKQAFSVADESIYLGKVKYCDHDEPSSTGIYRPGDENPLNSILQKRVCYKHENELRAFIDLHTLGPSNSELKQTARILIPEHGASISVDLNSLIDSITLGPKFPTWARRLLESALRRAGINPTINESDAFRSPPSMSTVV